MSQGDLELIRTILQAGTLITVVVGLGFTFYQLRLLIRQVENGSSQLQLVHDQLEVAGEQLKIASGNYADTYDWNRRKAAQEALEAVQNLSEDTPLLEEKFQIMSKQEPLALNVVKDECESSGAVRTALHKRLNHFEMIAVGVDQDVLDEQVVKEAYMLMLRKTLTQFEHYIKHRRNNGSVDAWMKFEQLSEKWRKEEEEEKKRQAKRKRLGEPSGQPDVKR